MTDRLESLQALRFFAAALVALAHTSEAGRLLRGIEGESFIGGVGSFGVDVFFVISGYVMAKTAPGKTPSRFMRQRLVRIVPIYWLMSLIMLPFMIQADRFGWDQLLSTASFYLVQDLPVLGVGWTLCFEMLFYVAVAISLYRPKVLIPALLAAFALCWLAREAWGGPFQFFGNPVILEFLVGVALYYFPVRSKVLAAMLACLAVVWLAVIGLKGVGAVNDIQAITSGEVGALRVLLMGPPAVFLVYAATQVTIKPGVLTDLGDASYSLYLIHPIFVMAAFLIARNLPVSAFVFMLFGLSVVASLASFRWLERPISHLLRPIPKAATAA